MDSYDEDTTKLQLEEMERAAGDAAIAVLWLRYVGVYPRYWQISWLDNNAIPLTVELDDREARRCVELFSIYRLFGVVFGLIPVFLLKIAQTGNEIASFRIIMLLRM
jgi:hypothetical protein